MINHWNYVPWNYWNKKLIFFQKKINVATKNGNSKEIQKLQQFLLQSTCLLWLASNILTQSNTNEINQTHDLTLRQTYDIIDQITQYEKTKQRLVQKLCSTGRKFWVQGRQNRSFKLLCPCVYNLIVYYMINLIVSPVYKLQTKNVACQTKQSSFGLTEQCWKQQRQIINKLAQNLKQPHKQIIQVRFNFKPLDCLVYPTQRKFQQLFDPCTQNTQNFCTSLCLKGSKSLANCLQINQSNGYFEPFNFAVKRKHKARTQNKINKISNQLDATRLSHFIVFSPKAKSCFYDLMRDGHCNNQTNSNISNFVYKIIINQIKQINQGTFSFDPKRPFDFASFETKETRANKVRKTKQVSRSSNIQDGKHVKPILLGYDVPFLPLEKVQPCFFVRAKEGKGNFLGNNKANKQKKILLLVPSKKVFQMEQQLCYCLFKLGYVTHTNTIGITNPILGFELLGWSFYINQQTKKIICLPSKTNVDQLKQKIKQTIKNKRYSLNQRLNKTHYLIWKWQNYHRLCYSKKKQLYRSRLWIISFIKKQSKMNADMRSKKLKKIFS